MGRLSSTFDLSSKLKAPDMRLNITPFVDIGMIAIFFGVFSSGFVFSPGLPINLPVSSEFSMGGMEVSSVLTVQRDNMYLFEGRLRDANSLPQSLAEFVQKSDKLSPVLLIKVNRDVSVQTFFDICEMAKKAGFTSVQLATERPESNPETSLLQ